ncbi:MAG TPA: peptidoglycan-binding protein, partial [Solirubrobacteraceae bacterium]|nr:peptidoglycan-binding protein [Solirubrobacteraceae bacterium]
RSRLRRASGRVPRRALALAALALVAAVVALIATDPFAGGGKPGAGVADNATATSLATVRRRSLSQQTQVSGTLGYAGSASIRVPSGTAPSAVRQAGEQVSSAETMLATARSTLASDARALAARDATLAATRAKEQVDCAGDGAAEAASAGSTPAGEDDSPSAGSTPAGEGGSPSAGASPCSSDAQAVSSAQQGATGAAAKLGGDRSQLSSAERQLASARSSLSAARSTAALYGQSSTFTALPSVGEIVTRGQSLYRIDGQPALLLYGSAAPARAFVAGMSPGRDVAQLNANLDALGYGQGLTGDAFTAATEAAIRALQSAHGASVTGELLLGSIVFERGPVRVTSVTPTVGSAVAPGPVLAVTSTARQVKLALDASQQGSVKVGDAVTITLPDNATTPGRITYVSSVATTPSSSGKGGEEESAPTVEVDATPTDAAATGHLDEAPVNVEITTESVEDALAVPVDALLALAGGNAAGAAGAAGYAVELAEGRVHRLLAVTVGVFDDAEGLVQVSGRGLSAGQRVVVPASS